MDTLLGVLQSAAKGGYRTSEFWLGVMAMVLPYATSGAQKLPGTAGVIAQIGIAASGAAVAAVYANSRGKVKAATVQAAALPASSEVAAAMVDAAARGGGTTPVR